jgi:dolichol-phosphate mannosyltransferase
MQLSIIIPVQDEADSIEPLLEELRVAMGELPGWEVLVVDDGSSDDTAARVRACAAAGYPGLRLLCHARGCGQSAALRTGAEAARGAWLGTLDGDGQNDPADLARMWRECRAMRHPPALWIGHRVERLDDGLRRLSSRVANAVRGALPRKRRRRVQITARCRALAPVTARNGTPRSKVTRRPLCRTASASR